MHWRLCRYGALAFFDYAAAGPYVDIKMHGDATTSSAASSPSTPLTPGSSHTPTLPGAGAAASACADAVGHGTSTGRGACILRSNSSGSHGSGGGTAAVAPGGDPLDYKDAVFISPHKFVGGPGTPGLLIVRRGLLKNTIPAVPGGGTVSYVNETEHK